MNKVLIFGIGAAIGGVAGVFGTRKYFKKKYETIAQEEIDSVKEVFAKERDKTKPAEKEKTNNRPIGRTVVKASWKERKEADKIIKDAGYSEADEEKSNNPYVITPEEFGSLEGDGYDMVSLCYYLDGTLAEGDHKIDDIDGTVGLTSLNHFGEYEDDSVFVRNDRLKADFEILLDQRRFDEVF